MEWRPVVDLVIWTATSKTHCPQGHPYDETNTYRWKNARSCKTCIRARSKRKEVN